MTTIKLEGGGHCGRPTKKIAFFVASLCKHERKKYYIFFPEILLYLVYYKIFRIYRNFFTSYTAFFLSHAEIFLSGMPDFIIVYIATFSVTPLWDYIPIFQIPPGSGTLL